MSRKFGGFKSHIPSHSALTAGVTLVAVQVTGHADNGALITIEHGVDEVRPCTHRRGVRADGNDSPTAGNILGQAFDDLYGAKVVNLKNFGRIGELRRHTGTGNQSINTRMIRFDLVNDGFAGCWIAQIREVITVFEVNDNDVVALVQ